LCHLSLHCFPIRPGNCFAMKLQFLGPWSLTSLNTRSSSSFVLISAEVPKVLWQGMDWGPFASDGDIAHQFCFTGMKQFFSNFLLRTLIRVVAVFRLLGMSTNVSGEGAVARKLVIFAGRDVDFKLRICLVMCCVHREVLHSSQPWWWLLSSWEKIEGRGEEWSLVFFLVTCELITTITANLLPASYKRQYQQKKVKKHS